MKRIVIAALLVGSGLAAVPAAAQYGRYSDDDYDYRPRRGREYESRDYDRRREYEAPRRGYSGPPPGAALGGSCVTRGSPAPNPLHYRVARPASALCPAPATHRA